MSDQRIAGNATAIDINAGLKALIQESGVRLEDERIALSMAQLNKLADREDAVLSPSDFRRVIRSESNTVLLSSRIARTAMRSLCVASPAGRMHHTQWLHHIHHACRENGAEA